MGGTQGAEGRGEELRDNEVGSREVWRLCCDA